MKQYDVTEDDDNNDVEAQKPIPHTDSGTTTDSDGSSDSNSKGVTAQTKGIVDVVLSKSNSNDGGVETTLASSADDKNNMMESQDKLWGARSNERQSHQLHNCNSMIQHRNSGQHSTGTTKSSQRRVPTAQSASINNAGTIVQICHSIESRNSSRTHASRVDVHVCTSTTCDLCRQSKDVTFIEAEQLEQKMVNKLRATGVPSKWWEFGVSFVELYQLAQVRAAEKGRLKGSVSSARPITGMSREVGGISVENQDRARDSNSIIDDASNCAVFSRTAPQKYVSGKKKEKNSSVKLVSSDGDEHFVNENV